MIAVRGSVELVMRAALMVGLALLVTASGCGRINFDLLDQDGEGGIDASVDAMVADASVDAMVGLPQWAQEAYVKASNTDASDQLGYSVALSDDGSALAVGAILEASAATGIGGNEGDNSAALSGAVYVFRRAAGVWTQEAYVKASTTDTGDQFGYSVSLSGDGSTLAVGAILEASAATGIDGTQADNSAFQSGAVYVFRRATGAWSQEAYIKASNSDKSDFFGVSLSLSGDGSALAVGAILEASAATGIGGTQADNSAIGSGAVYVFRRAAGVWSQEAYVKASNTDASDQFGHSVSLSGDGSTLAVGARQEASAATGIGGTQADNSAGSSGAVYVFRSAAGLWSQEAYVKASNSDTGDQFGYSVALSGDGSTLAVGAIQEDSAATGIGGTQSNNAVGSGAVYVFRRAASAWTQEAYVKASNTDEGDGFGWHVSLSGDGSTLAVGAFQEASATTGIGGTQADNSAFQSGAVYVFRRAAGGWSQEAYVKASNTDAGDRFGYSVVLSDDGSTLAVGAIQEDSAATGLGGTEGDNSASGSGAVYTFNLSFVP